MALERCEDCEKMHYRTNPCAQMIAKKSVSSRAAEPSVENRVLTAARKVEPAFDRQVSAKPGKAYSTGDSPAGEMSGRRGETKQRVAKIPAGTQALPVDTIPKPKMGRPRIHPDRRAYLTQKQREYREKKRAAK